MKNWITFLGTGFWVGYIPLAPGTMGTLVGVILYLVLSRILPHPLSYAIMIVAFTGLGVWVSKKCESYSKEKDNKVIVIDEIDGFLISMFALPFSFRFILLGFILFRVFDILKPFKIERIQKLPGGWGIMADDIAAGVLANIVLHISRSMFGW
jgi:phosphatidylglycerophosphatase A